MIIASVSTTAARRRCRINRRTPPCVRARRGRGHRRVEPIRTKSAVDGTAPSPLIATPLPFVAAAGRRQAEDKHLGYSSERGSGETGTADALRRLADLARARPTRTAVARIEHERAGSCPECGPRPPANTAVIGDAYRSGRGIQYHVRLSRGGGSNGVCPARRTARMPTWSMKRGVPRRDDRTAAPVGRTKFWASSRQASDTADDATVKQADVERSLT
jgi:hypothetical protein